MSAGSDPVAAGSGRATRSILLVDDDETFAYAAAQALKRAGFMVFAVPDYRGALAALESEQPIDPLVTDVLLPSGTPHGFALARMARFRRADLKVLYVTAHPDLVDEAGTVLGKILFKPIDLDALVAEVAAGCR